MTAFEPTPLSDVQYQQLTAELLTRIEETADRWLQNDVVDIDCDRTGGMLTLTFPNRSQVVVNLQPPLHEVWLAARSGGYHFKHSHGQWRDTRDGREFFEALAVCVSEQAGQPLAFNPEK